MQPPMICAGYTFSPNGIAVKTAKNGIRFIKSVVFAAPNLAMLIKNIVYAILVPRIPINKMLAQKRKSVGRGTDIISFTELRKKSKNAMTKALAVS